MTHTTNLNLNKPDLNDNVNVATDINDNMELIDAAYGNMRDDFGDVYDPTATYAKDAICIYNNVLYQANTAINTPEEWNASHWDARSVADLVGALNSKITNKLVYKASHVSPSDTTNKIYNTDVKVSDYFFLGAFTPFDNNIEVRMTNTSGANGIYRYTLWDTVQNTKIVSGYDYWVYCAFLERSGLKEIT